MLRIILISTATIIFACNHRNNDNKTASKRGTTPVTDTSFIPADTANRMIDSYFESIATDSPEKLQAWQIDAGSLRSYLANTDIKSVNISLAHNLAYINSGHFGQPACLSPDAMTIIISGASADGNTIYYNTSYLLNRAKPCPPICLTSTSFDKK